MQPLKVEPLIRQNPNKNKVVLDYETPPPGSVMFVVDPNPKPRYLAELLALFTALGVATLVAINSNLPTIVPDLLSMAGGGVACVLHANIIQFNRRR